MLVGVRTRVVVEGTHVVMPPEGPQVPSGRYRPRFPQV